MDTPFGTYFTRHLNPVPDSLGPKKLRSERKCSLDKAFVGHGGCTFVPSYCCSTGAKHSDAHQNTQDGSGYVIHREINHEGVALIEKYKHP